MQSDPILREVYRIKDKLARQYGGDVHSLFEHLREAAKKHPERMVKPPPKPVTRGKPRSANRKAAK